MLLVLAAQAETLASSFATDDGAWTGGTVADGVLSGGDLRLELASVASFTLEARVRVAAGERLAFSAGEGMLEASYSEGAIVLGDATAQFPLAEQAWSFGDVMAGTAPDAVRLGDAWILYREVEGEIHAATSADGATWTDEGAVLDGGSPSAVTTEDGVAMFYACGGAVCRADAEDGLGFGEAAVLMEGEDPAAYLDTWGIWHLWATRGEATVLATGGDGFAFAEAGELGAMPGLDVAGGASGVGAVWASEGAWVGAAGADADLAAVEAVAAGFEAASPALWLEGTTWHLWTESARMVQTAVGTPTPGSWVGLSVEWDGATLTTRWGAGAQLETSLDAVGALGFSADGTLEIDEYLLVWEAVAPDTGDTGSVDTGGEDSGDDTAGVDTSGADSAGETGVEADTAITWSAAELAGERGGCGCGTGRPEPLGALAALLVALRRRSGHARGAGARIEGT